MAEYETMTETERVIIGIDWLNQVAPPEWWNRVEAELLNMREPDDCVLGQVFQEHADLYGYSSGYSYALHELFDEEGLSFMFECGFIHENANRYPELHRAWIAGIAGVRESVMA
jgi:hypothetical protein